MRALGIIVLGLALCACGGKDDDKGVAKGTSATDTAGKGEAEPPPRLKAFEGELTYARMESGKAKVKPGDEWVQAFDLVQAEAGKPTEIDGSNHLWYLLDGDKCHELSLQSDGTKVGSVSLGTYDKIMKSKYEKCAPEAGDGAAKPEPKLMGPGKTGTTTAGEGDEGGW